MAWLRQIFNEPQRLAPARGHLYKAPAYAFLPAADVVAACQPGLFFSGAVMAGVNGQNGAAEDGGQGGGVGTGGRTYVDGLHKFSLKQ